MKDDDLIPVCDECYMASCWQGMFMCEKSRDAGVIDVSVKELRLLRLEHEQYWRPRSGIDQP